MAGVRTSGRLHEFARIALILGWSVLATAASFAQTAAPAEPKADADDQQVEVHASIPPLPTCLALAGDWSEPEKWAWTQICSREPIDFDKRYGTSGRKNFDGFDSDPRRLLSAAFVRQIFENPRLAPFVQGTLIEFAGAYIPFIEVGDATIGSLTLSRSKVGGDLRLSRVTIARSLRLLSSELDGVTLFRVQGGNVEFNATTADDVSMQQLGMTRMSFVVSRLGSLKVLISRFSEQFAILRSSFREDIFLSEVKSDGLYLRPSTAGSIKIETSVDTGMFFLEVIKWADDATLSIHTTATGRFVLRRSLPKHVSLSGFTFAGADWGPDPVRLLKAMAAATTEYNPGVYTALAESYTNSGQSGTASDIMIEKRNAEYAHADSWLDKGSLFVIWLLADYGYRPEIGLLWILGFVGITALIFKTGEKCMTKGTRPRNWLVFAFDAVIPGIQLDSEHGDIGFSGWRQYFLYILRFLSAVVVVLVIEMLRRSLPSLV
jgi:hypothetical protein